MKLLRNPIVVGVLAVLALVLIFRNALAPLWSRMAHRSSPVKTGGETPVAAPAPAPVPATPAVTAAPVQKVDRIQPEANIDLTQVGWKWNGSPRRDPFQITPSTSTNINRLFPPAMELLTLNAIWRQTGSSLAVVNGKILRAGDTILSFKVESIEGDSLWVQGPSGREAVEFKTGSYGPNGTNQNVKAGAPAGTAMR